MRLKQYITEKNLTQEQWDKKFLKISNSYKNDRYYKDTIKKMIKDRKQYYIYNNWDDIISYASDNAGSKKVGDELNTQWLDDFESSLEAILSQAKDDLG